MDDVVDEIWLAAATHPQTAAGGLSHSYLPRRVADHACARGYSSISLLNQLLNHPDAPADILAALTTHPQPSLRRKASAHPNIDYSLIAGDPVLALAHPRCPPEVVTTWCRAGIERPILPAIKQVLIRSPHLSPEYRRAAAQRGTDGPWVALLRNPSTTHNDYLLLCAAVPGDATIVAQLADVWSSHPHADPTWLHHHLDSRTGPAQLEGLLANPALSAAEQLAVHARFPDDNGLICTSLDNPNTTPELLTLFTGRQCERLSNYYRRLLAEHPNITESDLTPATLNEAYHNIYHKLLFVRRWARDGIHARTLLSLWATWTGSLTNLLGVSDALLATAVSPTVSTTLHLLGGGEVEGLPSGSTPVP